MAEYRILSWRGIPAQVKADAEGERLSGVLPPRYQEEIDRVAMEEGLMGSDEYLEHWQWGPTLTRSGGAQEVLDAVLTELREQWDQKLFGKSLGP